MRSGLLLAVAALVVLPSLAAAQSVDPNSNRYSDCSPGLRSYINYGMIYIPGVPYTATVKVTLEKKQDDGTIAHNVSRLLIARDSMGKARYEESHGCWRDKDGRTYDAVFVTIGDPVAGTFTDWSLVPNTTKVAQLNHRPQTFIDAQSDKLGWDYEYVETAPGQPTRTFRGESIGNKVIHGIEVKGRRITVTTPPGGQGNTQPTVVVHELWISTTLGVEMAGLTDDPERGHTEMELENFTLGEPDPSMFQVPASYTVIDQSTTHAPTPSPARVSSSPAVPYSCSNVTRHIQDPLFAPGQHWSYKTRLQDVGSTLNILEIDRVPELGVVLWVSVDHVHIPDHPMGPSETYSGQNFVVTRDALEASGIQLIDKLPLTSSPNYGYWIRDCVALTYRTPIADALNSLRLKECQDNATQTKQDPSQCPSMPNYPATTPAAFPRSPLSLP